jgi:hypothetical protein
MRKLLAIFWLVAMISTADVTFSQTNATVFKLDNQTKDILRDAMADRWFKKEAFTSALLGAATAILAAWLAFLWQSRRDQKTEDQFNQRILDAIEIELKTLMEIYDSDESRQIKDLRDGETFPYWFHFSQKHFVIFESNTSHIGKIDHRLAGRIIKVYELMKVFVEAMGINSYHVRDLEQVQWGLKRNPDDQYLLERKQQIDSLLATQANRLKQIDKQMRSEAEDLFRHFKS